MRFVSLLLVFLSTTAIAQAPVSAELISDPFVESYQPEVSVSGNVIVGVMTMAAAGAMLKDEISVHSVAHAGSDEVCLRVASRDGIYTSKNIYSVPGETTGPVRLPYRSSLTDVVEKYGDDEIAIAATVGNCDSGSAEYFLLSATSESAPSDLVIYLNSFGATDVYYQVDSDIEDCEYISEGRRTTYDFICRLDSIAAGEALPVTIIRERFGREQPSVEITIVGSTE